MLNTTAGSLRSARARERRCWISTEPETIGCKTDGRSGTRIPKRSGYETGYIGKWRLYGSPDGKWGRREAHVPRDFQLGFDYWKGFECTHEYNDSHYFFSDDPTGREWNGYDAFPQAEDTAAFIRDRANSKNPYLLMLSWVPPHFPLHTVPQEHPERYENRDIVLRAIDELQADLESRLAARLEARGDDFEDRARH